MKPRLLSLTNALAIAAGFALANSAAAAVTINSFDNFTSDALYGSWASGTIVSGPTSYSITATGYGSNWKYNPVNGSGFTTVELTVSLAGLAAADGKLGPIITLEDGDGTSFNYAWYGQNRGNSLVLTMGVDTPTSIGAAGTTPGLDLATLTHLHMQLDPSSYTDPYTVTWENLSLIGAIPEPSSLALLAVGGLALAAFRRRVR